MSPSSIIPRPRPFNRTPQPWHHQPLGICRSSCLWSNERAFRLRGAPSGRVHGDAQLSAKYKSENHGGGGGRGCTGTGHRRQSKLHSPRQGRVMDARNESPPTAANMSWVSGQTERPKDGKPAGRTEPSAIFDARRGIKSIFGVRCSGHPTWREGLEQRTERSMARYALVPNRDTPMAARAVERGVL